MKLKCYSGVLNKGIVSLEEDVCRGRGTSAPYTCCWSSLAIGLPFLLDWTHSDVYKLCMWLQQNHWWICRLQWSQHFLLDFTEYIYRLHHYAETQARIENHCPPKAWWILMRGKELSCPHSLKTFNKTYPAFRNTIHNITFEIPSSGYSLR